MAAEVTNEIVTFGWGHFPNLNSFPRTNYFESQTRRSPHITLYARDWGHFNRGFVICIMWQFRSLQMQLQSIQTTPHRSARFSIFRLDSRRSFFADRQVSRVTSRDKTSNHVRGSTVDCPLYRIYRVVFVFERDRIRDDPSPCSDDSRRNGATQRVIRDRGCGYG